MSTTNTPLSIVDVFGDDMEHHVCCSCCEGYCPHLDGYDKSKAGPEMLFRVGDYLSDRYAAIRADLLEDPGERVVFNKDLPDSFTAPDAPLTEESKALFHPSRAMRLLRAGFDIRGEERGGQQHLYLNQEHVGWFMAAGNGLPLDEIRTLDRDAQQAVTEAGLLADIMRTLGMDPIDALHALREAGA